MKKIRLDNNTLFVILTMMLMIVTFIPIATTSQSSVLMGLIIVVGLLAYPEIKNTKAFLELFLFIIVITVYFLVGKGLSFNTFGLLYWILRFVSAVVIGLGIKHLKDKQIRILALLLIGLMIYSNISTIVVSIANPMALRTFGYSLREANQDYLNIRSGLGPIIMYSYGVGEAMAIIAPTLLALSLTHAEKSIKYLGVVAVGLSVISQAMAALTASLFLTVFFCAMVVLTHFRLTQTKNKFRTALVVIVLLMIGSHYFTRIVGNNYLLADKFGDVLTSFRTGSSSGDVSVRSILILRSLKAWLANPVFGWADIGGLGIENGVSMHSAIFDYLGLYGIFTFLLIGVWRRILAVQFQPLSQTGRKYFRWGVLSLVILLIVKGPVTIGTNILFSVGFSGLLIRGASNHIIQQQEAVCE